MPPLLCVTVTAPTMAELRRRRDEVRGADLIELRLDSVSDPDVAGALAGRRGPVVVTCRPTWEGGSFRGPEESRRRLLAEALQLGAEYVDVEWHAGFDDLIAVDGGRRVVLSNHSFDGVPGDFAFRLRAMRACRPAVIKLAAKANCLTDCVGLRDLGSREGKSGGLVLIAMGEHGFASRVLAGRFGSMWTYAGAIADVGQTTPEALLEEFRFRDVGEATDLYGLVGAPISHSLSPAMHNAGFRAAGVDAVYLPLPATSADDFLAFAAAFGVKGASVTTPYKVPLLERVDRASEMVRRVGAVNTLRADGVRWLGENTDVSGFLEPLRGRFELAGSRAAILGSGGAARSVAVALQSRGASVTVHARDRVKAAAVAELAGGSAGAWPPGREGWDLLVNCTPVGTYPNVDQTPIDAGRLTGRAVYDLVYNPQTTRLLREAAEAGLEAIGGLGMLVAQAQDQFEWWTGVRLPEQVMREAAAAKLRAFGDERSRRTDSTMSETAR